MSLSNQIFPQEDYEMVVIDNNSTDNTEIMVQSLMSSIPNLRYVKETNQGLSYARNRGIKESKSNIVAFTDDDIEADKYWIKEMVAAFEEHPDVTCVGGQSRPVFVGGAPVWICDDLLRHYGDTRFGDQPRYLSFPEFPFGLNMAFRRNCFQTVGYFDHKLGRTKLCLLADEEKDIFYRINRANLKTFYTPYAVVYHMIPPERSKRKWILKRAFWQGVSRVIFELITNSDTRLSPLKEAYGEYRTLMRDLKRRIVKDKKLNFQCLIIFLFQVGQIWQYLRLIRTDNSFE